MSPAEELSESLLTVAHGFSSASVTHKNSPSIDSTFCRDTLG